MIYIFLSTHKHHRTFANMSNHRHRRKNFKEPTPLPVGNNEHYAIIMQFHGGYHKHCTVQVYDTEDNVLVKEPMYVKLKGSLKPKKTGSQLNIGAFVRITYGEISLVYKWDDALRIIPQMIRQTLLKTISTDHLKAEEIQFEIDSDRTFILDTESDDCSEELP